MNRNSRTSPSCTTIFLALDAETAGFAGLGEGAERDELVIGGAFGGDEAALEIGMDDPGGRGRLVPGVDGPGPRFLFARGEVGAQTEQMISGANEAHRRRFFDPEAFQVFALLVLTEIDEIGFDLRGNDNRFGIEMGLYVLAHGLDMRIGVGRGKLLFRDVAGEESRLAGEEEKALKQGLFVGIDLEHDGGFALVEMRLEFFDEIVFGLGLLVPSAGGLVFLSFRFCTVPRSERTSSVVMTSMSRTGSPCRRREGLRCPRNSGQPG